MKTKIIASLLILILLSTLAFWNISVQAYDTPTFSILPPVKRARAGSHLTFRLMAYSITEMHKWNATIEWDETYLEMVQDPLAGNGLSEGWKTTTTDPDNENAPVFANGSGWLWMSQELIEESEYDSTTFSEGSLALFYLRAKIDPPTEAAGGTPVNITSAVYYGPPPDDLETNPAVENATVVYASGVTTIEWLTHWTSVEELSYWDNCIEEFQADGYSDINILMTSVDFNSLYDIIMTRKAAGQMPDLMHMDVMWVPNFVDLGMLSVPPADVQDNIWANWTEAPVAGSEYQHTIWGYPTEFNSWGLVYNKKILQEVAATNATVQQALWDLNNGTAITWGDPSIGTGVLEQVAEACTDYADAGVMNRSGWYPVMDASPEEERFQFMSLLWSNGGTYINFTTNLAEFNETEGLEVLQLYNWSRGVTWDPVEGFPGGRVWWDSWDPAHYEIAIMVLPTWMTYIRDAMGDEFNNETLGIAPVPIGPSGNESWSLVYNWIATVSKAAEDQGNDEAAWTFLNWINTPQPNEAPYDPDLGGETNVTRMGEFLIMDSIIPSRISDQENFDILTTDFWFKGFIDISKTYGRADTYFRTSEQVQYEVFEMIEHVAIGGDDPQTTADYYAGRVNSILPPRGDIYPDNVVNILDLVILAKAWGTKPGQPGWDPRADINYDNKIGIFDLVVIARNYGRYNGLYVPRLYISPATLVSVYPSQVTVGKYENFSVNVTVTNATNLYCYEFKLYYDRSVLNCTGVMVSPFGTPYITARDTYDNVYNATHGRIWVATSLTDPMQPKNGSGVLATITFDAIAEGISFLNLSDTALGNFDVEVIPHTSVNGKILVLTTRIETPIKGENAIIEGNVTATDTLVTKNALHLAASGPTGSTGWFNVTFPMVNTTDITVFINKVKLTPPPFPIITTNDTHYFIYFEFTLSTHNMTIRYAIPGDITANGKVNIYDLRELAKAYGSKIGEPKYNPNADLDDLWIASADGKVNIYDLRILAKDYGK